jgi:pimeloyl-ACP methyl ester carboxylesterase
MWSEQMIGVAVQGKAIAYDRRGFGKTRYVAEEYSSVADLIAVLDALADGRRAVLVGCSQGGRVALDAALEHPTRVSGLVLIAPNVTGAYEPDKSPEISNLLAEQAKAIKNGDIDIVNAIKARLWLDGPLESEGRVSGKPRDLLLDMNSIVLRAQATGNDLDVAQISPAFDRLAEIKVPALMIWGALDFPHIKERCQVAANRMSNCATLEIADSAHLPSLDKPNDVTAAIVKFARRVA